MAYAGRLEQIEDQGFAGAITAALERMHREEFDEEILNAASEVTGCDMSVAWRPSFAYLPPAIVDGDYHVAVYATGVCENSPTDRVDTESIQARLRSMTGSDQVFVDDYFDQFAWASGTHWVID
jgi:hypothetical protein